jgi:hypothetical protein
MQYSSRTMLIVVVAAAVLLTCLVYPDPIVGDIAYTFGLLLVAFGTIGAIYVRGQRRAFLVGFLIAFGSYYYSSLWATETRIAFLNYQQGIRYGSPGLITTRLLASAFDALHSRTDWMTNPGPGRFPGGLTTNKIYGGYMAFMALGHTIIGLGLGMLGGWVAQRLAPLAPPPTRRSLEEILHEMDSK